MERVYFEFDPNDKAYHTFLERCKSDTRSLQKKLEELAAARNIQLRFTPKRHTSGSRQNLLSCYFLIRTPMLRSMVIEREESRMQTKTTPYFALHFDENHRLHDIRTWTIWGKPDLHAFTSSIHVDLAKQMDVLSSEYGNWDAMAERILDTIVPFHIKKIDAQPSSISATILKACKSMTQKLWKTLHWRA